MIWRFDSQQQQMFSEWKQFIHFSPHADKMGIWLKTVIDICGMLVFEHPTEAMYCNALKHTGGQYGPYCPIGWSDRGLGLPLRDSPGAAAVGLVICVPLLGSVAGGVTRM
ncbi:hypothetical protein ElyMa_002016200 [Elysia marginata]|uniref:Uncharacterized protein n=1 Tax=Elysia marginata TaxID=1093978 RepID=A0AAV4F5A3_9GAST|nr:hypothetical protein ElyMa_002016200 [Elysia marginata]